MLNEYLIIYKFIWSNFDTSSLSGNYNDGFVSNKFLANDTYIIFDSLKYH